MQAAPGHIIVKITDAMRREIFERPIVSITGEKFFVLTKVKEEAGMENYFAQGVSVGEAVAVGAGVDNVQICDTVMLDYIIDVNDQYTIEKTDDYKLVSVNVITKYMKEDKIIPPNRIKPRPTIVHKKGELDEGAMLLATVRDNIITPNFPYIFMDYREENIDEFYNQGGSAIWSRSTTTPVVERKVLLTYPGSDIKPGDTVLIEADELFSRSLGDNNFDVAYGHTVIAIESE